MLCSVCNETFSLRREYKECTGAHGGGHYTDSLNARVWGDKSKVFLLGFANNSLVKALKDQLNMGDQLETYMPGYGMISPGRNFDAFVIPESANSVTWEESKFNIN